MPGMRWWRRQPPADWDQVLNAQGLESDSAGQKSRSSGCPHSRTSFPTPFPHGPATTALLRSDAVQAIADSPRAVQSAALATTKSTSGRREMLNLQLSPGTPIG